MDSETEEELECLKWARFLYDLWIEEKQENKGGINDRNQLN